MEISAFERKGHILIFTFAFILSYCPVFNTEQCSTVEKFSIACFCLTCELQISRHTFLPEDKQKNITPGMFSYHLSQPCSHNHTEKVDIMVLFQTMISKQDVLSPQEATFLQRDLDKVTQPGLA